MSGLRHVDALVVGAGPAGSTVARALAERGHSVTLIDRAEFPRDKPCGGGVTLRCASLLPFDLSPVVERVVGQARFRFRGGREVVKDCSGEMVYMTTRRRLDQFLVDRAAASGVSFEARTPFHELSRGSDGRYEVRAGSQRYSARVVVGADGANSRVARSLGLERIRFTGIALEANIPLRHSNGWPLDQMGLQLGRMPGGYGWVFPKGDHINVGVGGWRSIGTMLRPALRTLCRSYGFDPSVMEKLRGHPLPLPSPTRRAVVGHAALVGDAAGLCDPMSGEGIFAAIQSGIALAEAADDLLAGRSPSLDSYQRCVDEEILPELLVSRAMYDIYHAWTTPWILVLMYGKSFWTEYCSVAGGHVSHQTFVRQWGGPLASRTLKPAARLARRATGACWGADYIQKLGEHARLGSASTMNFGLRTHLSLLLSRASLATSPGLP